MGVAKGRREEEDMVHMIVDLFVTFKCCLVSSRPSQWDLPHDEGCPRLDAKPGCDAGRQNRASC